MLSAHVMPSDLPTPSAPPAFALYIDADNQAAHGAAALLDVLQGLGGRITRVVVAGNDKGNKTAAWIEALRAHVSEECIDNRIVPCRSNAADIALILALGADLDEHRRTQTRVVVVSRDKLLLDAAEQVKDAGVRLYVAYADNPLPTAQRTKLTTFLLPCPEERSADEAQAAPAPASPAQDTPLSEVQRAMAYVREHCTKHPEGGYSASYVGHLLSQLGYSTPAARRAILARFPNLQVLSEGPTKRLRF